MADFRALAEYLSRLSNAMGRAGGSAGPRGSKPTRMIAPSGPLGKYTAEIQGRQSSVEGGMMPNPAQYRAAQRYTRSQIDRDFTDDELLDAIRAQLDDIYGPFTKPTDRPRPPRR